jgi:hypothetical protein
MLPASIASLGAKVEQLSGGIDPGHCLLDARFVIRRPLERNRRFDLAVFRSLKQSRAGIAS